MPVFVELPIRTVRLLEARAPISGVILHINAVPSLKKGDNIADIGAIAVHAP